MAALHASLEFSCHHSLDTLGEGDLVIEGVESMQLDLVLPLPGAPRQHLGCQLRELCLEVCHLLAMADGVGLEAGYAPLELTALGAVGAAADGAEVLERRACGVEPPLSALAAVLLPGERLDRWR